MTLVEQLAQEISIISGLPTVLVMDKAKIIIQELRLVQLAEDQSLPKIPNRMGWFADEIIGECKQTQQTMLKAGWRKVIEEH